MKFIMSVFGYPLGFVMLGCYWLMGSNYALAIALFTLVTRLLLLPFAIRQQKENLKAKLLRTNIASFLQLPILFGVLDVVNKPLYHIFRVGTEQINEMASVATVAGFDLGTGRIQPKLIEAIQEVPEAFSAFDQGLIQKITAFDMDFFGLNLSVTPKLAFTMDGSFNWYLVIPLICLVLHAVKSFPAIKKAFSGRYNIAKGVLMGLNLAMPVMSFFLCFIVPTGVGFYWMISAALAMIQSAVLRVVYAPERLEKKKPENGDPEDAPQSVAKKSTES